MSSILTVISRFTAPPVLANSSIMGLIFSIIDSFALSISVVTIGKIIAKTAFLTCSTSIENGSIGFGCGAGVSVAGVGSSAFGSSRCGSGSASSCVSSLVSDCASCGSSRSSDSCSGIGISSSSSLGSCPFGCGVGRPSPPTIFAVSTLPVLWRMIDTVHPS